VTGPYRLEILPGVSHWIPEEAPDQVASMLLEHLA
jgi:pimeloyl-ACP methyl ester carboxylesterase